MIFAGAMLASCIDEITDGCPTTVRFVVSADEQIAADFAERYDVRTLHVFAFDANTGLYVAQAETASPTRSGGGFSRYEFEMRLVPGDYRFVAWSNLDGPDHSLSRDKTQLDASTINDLYVSLDASVPLLTTNIADLHFGTSVQNVAPKRVSTVETVIVPQTYRVNFVVTGLPAGNNNFNFTVTSDARRHRFDSAVTTDAAAPRTTYRRSVQMSAQTGVIEGSMIILGLGDTPSRDLRFVFDEGGSRLYPRPASANATADLMMMIIASYTDQTGVAPDFGSIFEFTVPLKFEAGVGLVLDVNGWEYIEDNDKIMG